MTGPTKKTAVGIYITSMARDTDCRVSSTVGIREIRDIWERGLAVAAGQLPIRTRKFMTYRAVGIFTILVRWSFVGKRFRPPLSIQGRDDNSD